MNTLLTNILIAIDFSLVPILIVNRLQFLRQSWNILNIAKRASHEVHERKTIEYSMSNLDFDSKFRLETKYLNCL